MFGYTNIPSAVGKTSGMLGTTGTVGMGNSIYNTSST